MRFLHSLPGFARAVKVIQHGLACLPAGTGALKRLGSHTRWATLALGGGWVACPARR